MMYSMTHKKAHSINDITFSRTVCAHNLAMSHDHLKKGSVRPAVCMSEGDSGGHSAIIKHVILHSQSIPLIPTHHCSS